jgi:hypothetical protein
LDFQRRLAILVDAIQILAGIIAFRSLGHLKDTSSYYIDSILGIKSFFTTLYRKTVEMQGPCTQGIVSQVKISLFAVKLVQVK